jgi:hypothetical protein
MVADAVGCEPVSASKFPATREINREFRRISLLSAILKADTRANSEACKKFPTQQNRDFLRKNWEFARENRDDFAKVGQIDDREHSNPKEASDDDHAHPQHRSSFCLLFRAALWAWRRGFTTATEFRQIRSLCDDFDGDALS